jgi:aminoglycoside 3-N-acetyltransferase
MRDGRRKWWRYTDVVLDDRDFIQIGEAFEAARDVLIGAVGSATATLIPLCEAVDFAVGWLAANRVRARSVKVR